MALGLTVGASACHVMGRVELRASMVVYQEPPAPKLERAPEVREGFVWVAGHWESHGDQWAWIEGRYDRTRTGYAWADGRWERRGNSWHWIDGQWTAGAPPMVLRDHRPE